MRAGKIKSLLLAVLCCTLAAGCGTTAGGKTANKTTPPAVQAATAPAQEAVVYYSKNITPESVRKVYAHVKQNITGRVALKFHRNHSYTESAAGVALLKALQQDIPESALVETTFGGGPAEETEMRARFQGQGLDFAPIDVLNTYGGMPWPVPGGRLLKEAQVAKNLRNYTSVVVFAPFRGDAFPGYGGALTNIGVGLQDGKGLVHGEPLNKEPEFFERMAEAGKAVTSHFDNHMAYINVMYDVIVKCECNPDGCEPVNLGVLASTDPVAVDAAACDLVLSLPQHQGHDRSVRTGMRLGFYQQDYMMQLGMGTNHYKLVDVDKE